MYAKILLKIIAPADALPTFSCSLRRRSWKWASRSDLWPPPGTASEAAAAASARWRSSNTFRRPPRRRRAAWPSRPECRSRTWPRWRRTSRRGRTPRKRSSPSLKLKLQRERELRINPRCSFRRQETGKHNNRRGAVTTIFVGDADYIVSARNHALSNSQVRRAFWWLFGLPPGPVDIKCKKCEMRGQMIFFCPPD